ncbi:MAG: NAD(P)/FAD-dependent oxidoreductase, partial [Clostridiales bacterium]|nr:NAD(P)/FAD-dependent oxidoreductase [Clostridiales bacterium]
TKSLLYSAKIAQSALHGEEYGVSASGLRLDHVKVIERKNEVVRKLVGGVATALRNRKVEAVHARGVLKGRSESGFAVEAEGRIYEGARLLLCTGSEAIIPPIDGVREALQSGFALTSREILDLNEVPHCLTIVGGGVIGLELANYFAAAASEVTVVEMLPEVGGAIDADIAKNLRGNLEKLGVRFLLETKANAIQSGSVRVLKRDGTEEAIRADKVLLSIGRRPRSEGMGFETLGLYTEKGAVVTDARMRTNVPGVWAAGDVNGKLMLAHTAYREAAVAVSDMAGVNDAMRYDAVPQIVYTSPEAAGVGETERSAEAKGYVFDKAVLPLQYSGRYVCEDMNGDGFAKLLCERDTGRILGVHIIGNYASEIILSAAILVGSKWSKEAASKIVYPHPTVGEILRDLLI